MKFNKVRKKYWISGIISLSAVSLVAVGFSAWAMNGSVPDKANVSVKVGDIIDKTLIVQINSSDLSFAFDNSQGSNITNGNQQYQDLDFTIEYRLESSREIDTGDFQLQFSIPQGTITAYSALMSEGKEFVNTSCINNFNFNLPSNDGSGPITIKSNSDTVETTINYDEDSKGATVSTKFSFSWGAYFKNDNPGNYYKDSDDISVYLELCDRLHEFESATSNLPPVEITITPNYIGAN